MVSPEVEVAARAIYPDAGTVRLHPMPEKLFPPEADRPGLNRFDDPTGAMAVRYTATRLVGCLLETMSRFRPSPTAEAALRSVGGIDDTDVEWGHDDGSALRYRSRFVTDEPCWAIWQSTRVEVESVPLSPTNPHHVDAVRAVAATFEISLPPNW